MANILIVEDELFINELIKKNMSLVGHKCISAFDGREALAFIDQHSFDLILLDVMLPGLDGFDVFERIDGIPTIFLTAKNSLTDRVKGLNMGADDYLTKPFEMIELLARVDAVLRRTRKENESFELDNVKIQFDSRQIFVDDKIIECTPREYELLEVLVKNRNIALSREKLLELAWGYDYDGDTRTVDVHIQRLRKKLGLEKHIKTVYKLGYRLEVQA
ncbi:signal transduction response regulator [Gottschalkia purinilytica]|uniref:Signal transduction response regulator n=1 Tax=Gottschalkia purinilytica TaxID=1503 RepID=A0A0L0WC80_GOTPU|nr:response regulator transcription factor [Gottschalkia purinilytica]KNF09084.1 signal transduction response regulator [Gottschalkia purinilytica]